MTEKNHVPDQASKEKNTSPSNLKDGSDNKNITFQQLADPSQPIKLSVDTSTDWPTIMVGASSILMSIIVARLTYVSQKNQIEIQKNQIEAQRNQTKATAANFRANWQISLREAISKFVSIVAHIVNEVELEKDYLKNKESNSSFSQLIENQTRVELLLDPTKEYSGEIKYIMSKVISNISKGDTKGANEEVVALIDASAIILEKTWQDIQKDLYR